MNQKWKSLLRGAAGALAALVVLDVFCAWYYNPTAYEWDEYQATDVIRTPGAWTSRATEGVAWMRMDENGYNNPSVPGPEGVSVLMMGSSHTEALNVMQDQNASSLLGELLRADGVEGCVYNIGISSHQLGRNSANLGRALDRFEPSDYVVIETTELVFSAYSLTLAAEDRLGRMEATQVPLPEWLVNRPLSKALYNQWMNATSESEAAVEEELPAMEGEYRAFYEDMLVRWFSQMKQTADDHGVELILYYHPHLVLQPDGSATTDAPEGYPEAFASAAEAVGITFVDMGPVFLEAYAQDRTLPHGFINTEAGAGHLNPDGHALIARTLYEVMRGKEAEA